MRIKSIKTNTDYKKALLRLEKIFDAKPNTEAGKEADELSLLIEEYENIHYPIDPPDSISPEQKSLLMKRETELLEGKVKTKTFGEIKTHLKKRKV